MKISIITAVYNSENTIADAIKSVNNQTYNNIEHIIIDGCSTDGSLDVIKKNKSSDSLLVSEPDKGIYDALNKGISFASGDIIGFLHADDLFYNEYVIEEIVKVFEENKCDAVYGNLQYVAKENTAKVIRNWTSKTFKKQNLKYGWMPAHPTLYLKKQVYSKFGNFDLKFKIAADYDFMLRILSGGILTHFLSSYFVKMRIGGKSSSIFNLFVKSKEDLIALKQNKVGSFLTLLCKNIRKINQFFN